jgi:hypothetical protein
VEGLKYQAMDESNDDQPRGSREDSTRPLPLEAIEPGRQVTQVSKSAMQEQMISSRKTNSE